MTGSFKAQRFHAYGGSDTLVLESVPFPELKADEVLIEVHFAGVNPIDWKIRAGYLKDYMPLALPATPGIDVSGVVVELGSGVTSLKKGQAVFGVSGGSYGEYVVAKAGDVVAKPEGLSFELAATLPVGALTAWQAVEDAGVKGGQTVAVLGAAGGVGIFAVQFARLKGAKVIGVASTENLGYVESFGADKVVDYKAGPVEAQVKEVDVVIDLVGHESLEMAYGLLKKGGILVTVAGQVSEEKAKARDVRALSSGRGPSELLEQIAGLVADKRVRSQVGKIFALPQAAAAQDLCQTGHGRGRILLKIKA